jgi:hypothetical protein
MFGRDPRLPIDRLIEEEETIDRPDNWVTRHTEELREAHQRAAERLASKAEARQQQYNKSKRTKEDIIAVGTRVLTRNRGVKGRNKIQDRWSDQVYKVVEQRENGTYVIELADGHGKERLVNRAELQICPPTVLQPVRRIRPAQRRPAVQPGSSDDDTDQELAIDIVPPPRAFSDPEPVHNSGANSSDGGSEDSEDTEDELPLRRSTRATAGIHGNRFNLPRSVLDK